MLLSSKTTFCLGLLLLGAGCSTPKVAASEAFGPELTVHSVPEGAEIIHDGKSLGFAPVNIPIKSGDKDLVLEAHFGGYLPAKATLDASELRKIGGGETWVALKPDSMGTDAPDLNGLKAVDVEKGGLSLSKAKRCKEAMEFFNRALAIEPAFAKIHRDRAHCLTMTKEFDKAATELEIFLNLVPDAPDADKIQEEILRLRGRHDIDLGHGAGDKGF